MGNSVTFRLNPKYAEDRAIIESHMLCSVKEGVKNER